MPLLFKKVKENFYCSGNTKKFTKADVEKVCKVMDGIYASNTIAIGDDDADFHVIDEGGDV